MAQLIPFRAVRYQSDHIGDLGQVIAPPYDVISPQQQDALYQRSPHNVIRLELAHARAGAGHASRYQAAAETFHQWLSGGILAQDERPALYLYRQAYRLAGEQPHRTGVFGLVELEPWATGCVRPHEGTLSAPKADRLELMRACRANFSPVLGMFRDPTGQAGQVISDAASAEPLVRAADTERGEHTLWAITDQQQIAALQAVLADQPIYIADGHHRYETALAFRDEMRKVLSDAPATAAFNYVLMLLVSTDDPGLVILPTHRVVFDLTDQMVDRLNEQIEQHFEVEERPFSAATRHEEAHGVMRTLSQACACGCFALYLGNGRYQILTCKQPLAEGVHDVTTLHTLLIEPTLGQTGPNEGRIVYLTDEEAAARMVDEAPGRAAFFLNPTTIEQVQRAADAGQRLPGKSTYFYPKVPTGLVINKLDP